MRDARLLGSSVPIDITPKAVVITLMADQTWRRAIPLVVLLGCNGAIGGSGGPDGSDPFAGPGGSDVGVIGAQVMHRLNQTEYRNTTRDLLGAQLDPAANFPADDVSFGFDNIAQHS
jgi:hypothetical protein